jgi:uncharacterized membrane protein (TIGR02234 family)
MTAAILGCALGSAVVLFAAGATWAHVRVVPAAGAAGTIAPVGVEFGGADLAPVTASLGLVGLAGIVAVAATRRAGRVLVGVAVLAAGVGVAIAAGRVAIDPTPAIRASPTFAEVAHRDAGAAELELGLDRTFAPVAACLGGAVLALAGALVAVRGRAWPALGRRYQTRPAAPADAWDAVERGHDPTAAPDPTAASERRGEPPGDRTPAAP